MIKKAEANSKLPILDIACQYYLREQFSGRASRGFCAKKKIAGREHCFLVIDRRQNNFELFQIVRSMADRLEATPARKQYIELPKLACRKIVNLFRAIRLLSRGFETCE